MTPRLVLFDLDGTIYRGSEALPYAGEIIALLQKRGIKVAFVTNNSAAAPDGTAQKLVQMGIPAGPDQIFGSGQATVSWCLAHSLRSLYVIGEDALKRSFLDAGCTLADDDSSGDQPQAVVVGICRSFSYGMLRRASRAIRSGAPFVATNQDATFPSEGGVLDPGNGSLVAAVQTASGQEPIVIGKPSPVLLEEAFRRFGFDASDCLMVGDRFETDIAAAKASGAASYLVLTGVEKTIPPGQDGGADLRALADWLGL